MSFTKVTSAGIGSTELVTLDSLEVINNASIGGVLTYEDVTNVDSIGIITARAGVLVGSGITLSKDGDIFATGVTTATTFSGSGASLTNLPAANLTGTLPAISGANLTSLPAQATIANNADNRVITGGSGVNLNGEANLTFDGTGNFTQTGSSAASIFKVQTTATSGDALIQASGEDGSGNTRMIQMRTDAGAGQYRIISSDTSYPLALCTGNGERLTITGIGSVGINKIDPTAVFQVNSTKNAETDRHDATNYHLALRNPADDNGEAIGLSFGITSNETKVGAAILHERDGGGSQGSLQFYTSSDGNSISERLRIDSSGRLLIGTTTEGHANGDDLTIATSGNTGLTIRSGTSSAGNIYFSDGTSGDDEYRGFISYDHSNNLFNFATNSATKMTIDSSGRLLVGTTTARNNFAFTTSAKIQAEGAYNQGSISSTNTESNTNTCAFVSAKIRGTGAVSNNDIIGSHVFEGYDGSSFRRIARIDGIARDSGSGISNNVISGDLAFYTRVDANAEQEIVRFHHAKYALFGCNTLPSSSIAGASIDGDPSDLPVFIKTSSRQHGANAYTHFQFFNSNGAVGQILCSGTSTSYNTSSDYRLKENETAITDGITRLKQLKPYKFNFKTDSSTVLDGFFAHEVSSVVPDAVSGEKDYVATEANVESGLSENVGDPIYQQIDHSKLVPLLTAALQEEISKREALETRIAALEG